MIPQEYPPPEVFAERRQGSSSGGVSSVPLLAGPLLPSRLGSSCTHNIRAIEAPRSLIPRMKCFFSLRVHGCKSFLQNFSFRNEVYFPGNLNAISMLGVWGGGGMLRCVGADGFYFPRSLRLSPGAAQSFRNDPLLVIGLHCEQTGARPPHENIHMSVIVLFWGGVL